MGNLSVQEQPAYTLSTVAEQTQGRERQGVESKRQSSSNKSINVANKEKVKINKKPKSASYYMTLLVRAKTPSQAAAITRSARAELLFVKSSGNSSEDTAKMEKFLKRIVDKGETKTRKLKKEIQLNEERKVARKLKQRNRERQLTQELRRRKSSRKAMENADLTALEEMLANRNAEKRQNESERLKGDLRIEAEMASEEILTEIDGGIECIDLGGIVDISL